MNDMNVIFDLDGTLIDPSDAICNSINYALKEKGYEEVERSRLFPYIGRHLLDPFRDITGKRDEQVLWELIHVYRGRYETIGVKENRLYNGIKKMLSSLASKNFIASIKPWSSSNLILAELKIDAHFSGVYGSEVDGTRANKTELLKYLKEREGIENAIMVGDRDTDIIAAKICGFRSIGVSYGFGSMDELSKHSPDAIVTEPEDLERALRTLWKN